MDTLVNMDVGAWLFFAIVLLLVAAAGYLYGDYRGAKTPENAVAIVKVAIPLASAPVEEIIEATRIVEDMSTGPVELPTVTGAIMLAAPTAPISHDVIDQARIDEIEQLRDLVAVQDRAVDAAWNQLVAMTRQRDDERRKRMRYWRLLKHERRRVDVLSFWLGLSDVGRISCNGEPRGIPLIPTRIIRKLKRRDA